MAAIIYTFQLEVHSSPSNSGYIWGIFVVFGVRAKLEIDAYFISFFSFSLISFYRFVFGLLSSFFAMKPCPTNFSGK